MLGEVTRHMLPTWGPPPSCKEALKKEPLMTETVSCQLDLYTTSKQYRALWIIE